MKQWKAYVLTACLVTTIGLVAGCEQNQAVQDAAKTAATQVDKTMAGDQRAIELTYYVPLDSGEGIGPKTMKVAPTEAGMKEAVEAIIKEDSKQEYPLYPKGLKVLSIKVDKGMATVDLSKELMEGAKGGIMMSRMEIGAITNTLCNFPLVKRVRYTVEGKKLDVFGGLDLGEPVGADHSLIKK